MLCIEAMCDTCSAGGVVCACVTLNVKLDFAWLMILQRNFFSGRFVHLKYFCVVRTPRLWHACLYVEHVGQCEMMFVRCIHNDRGL